MSDPAAIDDRARKERSPSFPFIPLEKALERAKAVADAHKRNPARIPVVGETWGYGSKSSGLIQTVAAMKAYGLMEDIGRGEDRRIQLSDLAWRILHDTREGAKAQAIREAALKPRLIAEYAPLWLPERPSDGHCLSELHLDRGFTPEAARLFLRVFDETAAFANLVDLDKVSADLPEPVGESPMRPVETTPSQSPHPRGEPFVMSFGPGRLRGTFDLTKTEEADEMIRMITAMKVFLKDEADK